MARGGKRIGAGRKSGIPTKPIRVPVSVADAIDEAKKDIGCYYVIIHSATTEFEIQIKCDT